MTLAGDGLVGFRPDDSAYSDEDHHSTYVNANFLGMDPSAHG